MTGLIVFACILLFFAFILSIRAKIILEYAGEPKLTVKVLGFFKIPILPKKKKKPGPHSMSAKKAAKIKRKLELKKAKKAEKKRKKKAQKEARKQEEAASPEKKNKLSISEVLDLIDLVKAVLGALLGSFFKHLRVKVARFRIVVATGDAATTAIAYGTVTQAIGVLYPFLEQIPTVRFPKQHEIDVSIDYLREEPEVDLRMEFTLRVWHVFAVLFRALGAALKRGFRFLWNRAKRQDEQSGHKGPPAKHKKQRKKKSKSTKSNKKS